MRSVFFCNSADSLEHVFLECLTGQKLFQEVLTGFNNKHKVNFSPSKLQVQFKDYDPPQNTNSKVTRKFQILTVQTQKYYYSCKMLKKTSKYATVEVSANLTMESWKMGNVKLI